MRSVVVGLVAAVLAAGLAPVSAFAKDKPAAGVGQGDAKSHQQGMAETPPLIQQTGISCSPTDANLVGVSKEKNAQGRDTQSGLQRNG